MSEFQEQEKNYTCIDISLSPDGLINLIDHIESEGDEFFQLSDLRRKYESFQRLYRDIDDPTMKIIIKGLIV